MTGDSLFETHFITILPSSYSLEPVSHHGKTLKSHKKKKRCKCIDDFTELLSQRLKSPL